MRIMDYYEPTKALFINSHALKFSDVVDFKTAQIMYKVKNNFLTVYKTCLTSERVRMDSGEYVCLKE